MAKKQENPTQILARLLSAISQQPISSPSGNNTADLATSLLMQSRVSSPVPKESSGTGGPSVLERIFDVLSRPNYAIAETVDRITDDLADVPGKEGPGYVLEGLWKGLTGEEKTTFTKLWTQADKKKYGEAGPMSVAGGLFLDIFTDPTTYIGAGLIGKAGRAPKIADEIGEALTIADKVGDVTKAVPDAGRVIGAVPPPQSVTPDLGRAITPPPGARQELTLPPLVAPGVGTLKFGPEAQMGLREANELAARGLPTGATDDFIDEGTSFIQRMAEGRRAAAAARQPGLAGDVVRGEETLQQIARGERAAVERVAPAASRIQPSTPVDVALGTNVGRQAQSRMSIRGNQLNPVQQLELYRNALKHTTGEPAARIATAVKILREAENFLETQGIGFRYWDGQNIKLSDVVQEMGGTATVDALRGFTQRNPTGEIGQVIENLRARSAMRDSPMSDLAISQMTKKSAEADAVLTPARAAQVNADISKEVRTALGAANVAPANIDGTVKIIDDILRARINPAQAGLNRNQRNIHALMAGGPGAQKVWQQINDVVTRAIEVKLGTTARNAGTQIGTKAKVFDFLGERFATHWGMKDLRPLELDHLLSAESNAARRMGLWSKLVQGTTEAERLGAFKAAQGKLPPATVAEEQAMDYMSDVLSRLFASSGINSVATRSGMTMDALNSELKRVGSKYYFTKGDEYKDGIKWLDSWKAWNMADDPVDAMAKLELAVERLSGKYALYDDVAARWGSKAPQGEFRYKVDDPRFAGVWFDKDMASQVQKMLSNLDNVYEPSSKVAKYFDAIQRIWKTHVTIYSPSHHVNNLTGDAWLSWMAGVNNPLVYKKAADVLKGQSRRYESLDEVEALVSRGVSPKAGGKEILKFKGKPVTADEIYTAAHQKGILLSAKQLEDIFGDELFRGVKPFGGKVHGAASALTQRRDHWVRLAHFIDVLNKSKAKTLDDAFEEAAHTVRKYHPDGMDLTNFERKVMRRIIPFYSWQRKSIPLIMKFLVQKPGKVAMIPKGMEALQAQMGIEAPSRTDPFPVDQLFPDWMRESGIGPIAKTGMEGFPGIIAGLSRQGVNPNTGEDIGGYTVASPANPLVDFFAEFGGMGNAKDPIQGIASSVTPFAKVPAELFFDKNVRTEAPVSGDYNRYITEQIPLLGIASRITGLGIGGPTNRGATEGFNLEALINWLTGAGLIGTGPYQVQANIEEGRR